MLSQCYCRIFRAQPQDISAFEVGYVVEVTGYEATFPNQVYEQVEEITLHPSYLP